MDNTLVSFAYFAVSSFLTAKYATIYAKGARKYDIIFAVRQYKLPLFRKTSKLGFAMPDV